MDKLDKSYIWHLITLAKMKYKRKELKKNVQIKKSFVTDNK